MTVGRAVVLEGRHVGDVLFATPVIRALARAGYEVDVVAAPTTAGILGGHPRLRRVVAWRGGETAADLGGYDLAVVTDLFPEPAEAAFAAGIPTRAGYARAGRERWLTHAPPRRPGLHEIEANLDLVRALGIADAGPAMEVGRTPEAEAWAVAFLASVPRPRALLTPFAHPKHAHKAWPIERFAEVGRALAADGASVIVDGGPADAAASASLAASIPGARSTAGETDLPRLVSLVARSDIVVTIDTGPQHIAVALGVPRVALFGPTDPRMYGGYGPPHQDLAVPVECGPCYRRGPDWPYRPETCPFAYRCLTEIPAERVVEAARSALARGSGGRSPPAGLGETDVA